MVKKFSVNTGSSHSMYYMSGLYVGIVIDLGRP